MTESDPITLANLARKCQNHGLNLDIERHPIPGGWKTEVELK